MIKKILINVTPVILMFVLGLYLGQTEIGQRPFYSLFNKPVVNEISIADLEHKIKENPGVTVPVYMEIPIVPFVSDLNLDSETFGVQLVGKISDFVLTDTQKIVLDVVASQLNKSDRSTKILLTSHVNEPTYSLSKSRRLALSNALKVRSYLRDQGVRSTKINVSIIVGKSQKPVLVKITKEIY